MALKFRDSDDDQLLSEDDSDAECMFCAGLFSKDNEGEDWIGCNICFKWSHTLCANLDGEVSFVIYASRCVV
jgi:hypothetical protein